METELTETEAERIRQAALYLWAIGKRFEAGQVSETFKMASEYIEKLDAEIRWAREIDAMNKSSV